MIQKTVFIAILLSTIILFGTITAAQTSNTNVAPAAADPGQAQPASVSSEPTTEAQQNQEAAPPAGDLPLAPTPLPDEAKFSYNPQGARDPFVSLIERQEDLRVRPQGISGMQISEIALQGIQIGLGKVAIFKGSDNKAYPLREGESVYDGKLVEIANNKVVFEKIILDPFGREKEKQRIEVYLHRE